MNLKASVEEIFGSSIQKKESISDFFARMDEVGRFDIKKVQLLLGLLLEELENRTK